jgi:hypothetical protein
MQFRFAPGSLEWSDTTRVKLNRDHDISQSFGYAKELKSGRAGLGVVLKVSRGPLGDEMLQLAEDGVYDGLSAGTEFDMSADAVPDPRNKGGVLVRRATLRHVALTAEPAFDDARVTQVNASRGEGTNMPCVHCGQVHAEGVACSVVQPTATPPAPASPPAVPNAPPGQLQFSADQLQAILANPNGPALLAGLFSPAAPAAPEQREIVNPTRLPTVVTEPEPYRFNNRGYLTRGTQYDFSTDVITGIRDGDGEALARAQGFLQRHFDADRLDFDTKMADVATLNPNRQRPDLYVDQREFAYPIWDSIVKGTIPDNTPFVLPKFSASSGLVAAHVEGVEPALGVFQSTSQTVTPGPVSGKVSISREAWDQGGNPQMSGLIWKQMTRAWYEALEARAVTLLEAAAPTTITITTAAADAALDASLTSQLVPLQFVRGGFRMRTSATQVDLYKALAAAKDTAGRKLYPTIGAQNATGESDPMWAAINVGGIAFRPAWALAATGVVSANSYLYDKEDVSGWATAPNRLTFDSVEVRYVHLGIWGYAVAAITDLTGVRRLAYDPV